MDKDIIRCQNGSLCTRTCEKKHGDNIANIYEVVAASPQGLVHLLESLPDSTDPATWSGQNVPGYEPIEARLLASEIQGAGNGLYFTVQVAVMAPEGQSYYVVAVGISVDGFGVAVAVLDVPAIVAGRTPSIVTLEAQLNPVLS